MEIRSKVMSALRWSAAARFLGQAVSWGITIMVIRLLSPADYGLMAMAMVLVSFLVLLNTLGLDAVLVQDKDID
jgi:O-antigen/teichoic acid export membrane protein